MAFMENSSQANIYDNTFMFVVFVMVVDYVSSGCNGLWGRG